jgi:hypothetical protein
LSVSLLLLVVAVLLFLLAALISGGAIAAGVGAATLAYCGLAAFATAHLPLP